MARKRQVESPVLEVLITFKSGTTTTLHMTEDMFDTVFNSASDNFFLPAQGYYHTFLSKDDVVGAVVIGIIPPQEEREYDDYDNFKEESVIWQHQTTEGPASTD